MIRILEAFGEPILYGGQESFVFKTINNMNRNDMHFDFLTPYYLKSTKYEKLAQSIGSKIYEFNLSFKMGKSRLNVIKKYDALLKRNHYDVVHIHSGSISILALFTFYAKKNKINKIIVHSHMAGSKKNWKHEFLKKLYSPIFNYMADLLLAPSISAAYWQFSKKVFKKKGEILKNGIEIKKYLFNPKIRDVYRKKLYFKKNDIVLGNVGRLSKEKNQIFLIRLLKYANNKNLKLLLVGNGPCSNILKNEIKKDNLNSQIKFTGNVPNVEDYLQAVDIFTFPSNYEGLGIASIEAQASGLPVLSSNYVPKDIAITNNVFFLQLSVREWYKKIIDLSKKTDLRYNNQYFQIEKHGYNIKDTSSKLRDLYLK